MASFTPNELSYLLKAKWDELNVMDADSLARYRQIHIRKFDGDITPPLHTWPRPMRRIFFQQRPITDRETFTFFLFCLGNGYSTYRAGTWILSSYARSTLQRRCHLVRKRIRQMCWIIANVGVNGRRWQYFDMDRRNFVYFETSRLENNNI